MYAIRSYYDGVTLTHFAHAYLAGLTGQVGGGYLYPGVYRLAGAAEYFLQYRDVDHAVDHITEYLRITSYNVCYTKLLRWR